MAIDVMLPYYGDVDLMKLVAERYESAVPKIGVSS
jgi:hypothetical protein